MCNFTNSPYSDDAVARNFNTTLLYAKSDSSLIYAALITKGGADGFQSDSNYDFQMLVAEDGHNGDTDVTNYYFYVEIS